VDDIAGERGGGDRIERDCWTTTASFRRRPRPEQSAFLVELMSLGIATCKSVERIHRSHLENAQLSMLQNKAQ
jgi:hypothetical protein